MGSDLKIWVSDKLMSLVGYSQSTLVQYIISLSKKAKSPADIADALRDDLSGCSVAELQAFSRELFSKADRGRPAPNDAAKVIQGMIAKNPNSVEFNLIAVSKKAEEA